MNLQMHSRSLVLRVLKAFLDPPNLSTDPLFCLLYVEIASISINRGGSEKVRTQADGCGGKKKLSVH